MLRATQPNRRQKYQKMVSTKIVHTSGIFLKLFGFFGKMFKYIFNPCSYIGLNTQIPNPIFKITMFIQNIAKMPKYFRNVVNSWKQTKVFKLFKVLFYILYKFHNSYFIFL